MANCWLPLQGCGCCDGVIGVSEASQSGNETFTENGLNNETFCCFYENMVEMFS